MGQKENPALQAHFLHIRVTMNFKAPRERLQSYQYRVKLVPRVYKEYKFFNLDNDTILSKSFSILLKCILKCALEI